MSQELIELTSVLLSSLVAFITVFMFLYKRYARGIRHGGDANQHVARAAAHAVRTAELTVVRPILWDRMTEAALEVVRKHSDVTNPVQFRAILFCHLRQSMRLTEADHAEARQVATAELVDEIRKMRAPPFRLNAPADLVEHETELQGYIERACAVRRRASTVLLQQFSQFCGGSEHLPEWAAPGEVSDAVCINVSASPSATAMLV